MVLYGLCHSMLGLQVEVKVSGFASESPIANLGLLGLTLALVSALVALIAAHVPSNTPIGIAVFLLVLVVLSILATFLLGPEKARASEN